MKKTILFELLCIVLIVLFCFECSAQDVSSSDLIKDAKLYEGKSVTYRGEVVGDIMVRGEFAWLNVNDGSNAIGVWINKKLIKNILYTRSYEVKGDLVEVVGNFNRSCAEHGGDLDIHAQSINKLSTGSDTPHTVNKKAINFALVLFCLMLLAYLLKMLQSKNAS